VRLLGAIYGPAAPGWLREIPAVELLRRMWLQQYYAPDAAGVVRLRATQDRPPGALLLQSPYDPDARFSTKRETAWVGYRAHLTETCDDEAPHLITQVATVPATTNDVEMTAPIQADLAARDLLPGEHLLDSGYVDAQILRSSAARGSDLVGPALPDTSWQAAAGAGFALSCFAIDWDRRVVTCPGGKTSRPWTPPGAMPIRSTRCSSPRRMAGPVPRVPAARARRASRGNSPYGHARSMWPCNWRANGRSARSSCSATRNGLGWRAPWPRGCRVVACGVRVIEG
jgi:hypothetical protein